MFLIIYFCPHTIHLFNYLYYISNFNFFVTKFFYLLEAFLVGSTPQLYTITACYFERNKETSEVEKIIWDQVVYLGQLDLVRLFIWELFRGSCRVLSWVCPHTHQFSGLRIAENTSWLRIFLRLTCAIKVNWSMY